MPPISSCLCPSLEASLLPVLQGNTHWHKCTTATPTTAWLCAPSSGQLDIGCSLSCQQQVLTHSSVQFSSVAQSCLTLCDPMNCSTPGLPVHHELPVYPTPNPQIWHFVGASGKETTCQCRRHKRYEFDPCVGKIPCRRKWQPTPVFLPGESHGQRSLAGFSPQRRKESDMTEVI